MGFNIEQFKFATNPSPSLNVKLVIRPHVWVLLKMIQIITYFTSCQVNHSEYSRKHPNIVKKKSALPNWREINEKKDEQRSRHERMWLCFKLSFISSTQLPLLSVTKHGLWSLVSVMVVTNITWIIDIFIFVINNLTLSQAMRVHIAGLAHLNPELKNSWWRALWTLDWSLQSLHSWNLNIRAKFWLA